MAKVKEQSWGVYQASYTAYAAFFESFNSPLLSVSTASTKKCVVNIDNTLTVTFDLEPAAASSSTYQSVLLTYNGVTTRYASRCIVSRGLNVLCACSDTFVYINHWDGWGYRVEVVYDIANSTSKFYGWRDDSNGAYSIRNINFNSVQTGTAYTLASRLNTTAESGKVAFAPAILMRSGVRSFDDSNLICCTAVDNQKVLTMADGSRYFSVDTYMLVPYEEEENE